MKPTFLLAALVFLLACSAVINAQPEPRDERYSEALCNAVEKNDRAKVISLLDKGANINAIWINFTPLGTALFYQNVEMVKLLISRGAKVYEGDLAQAADGTQGDKKKALTLVNFLFEHGANVQTDGAEALRNAAIADNVEVLQVLLAKGANPNGRLDDDEPLLMRVIEHDSLDGIRLLLKAGADVKAVNKKQEAILMHAARATHQVETNPRVTVVKLLIDRGADVKARDQSGNTALHFAVTSMMTEAGGFIPRAEVIRLLLENGADINARNSLGETALMKILQTWRTPVEIVQLLLAKGSDINLANDAGETALMFAAEKEQTQFVELLLDKGANIDSRDKEGNTALVHAIQESRKANVDLLLSKHADLASTPYRDTAGLDKALQKFSLLNAIEYRRTAEVKSLLDSGADANSRNQRDRPALVLAADNSDKAEIMKLLLEHGAEIDVTNDVGNTALMVAAEANNNEGVAVLLERRAQTELRNKDHMTALMLAASRGNNGPSRLLVAGGADVNARLAPGGMTVLMFASKKHYAQEPLVKLLLDHGAEVNAVDENGETALLMAARASAFAVIGPMLDAGANVNLKNKAGETALQLAQKSKEGDQYTTAAIVKMLKGAGAKE